jgi:hypothetical protein
MTKQEQEALQALCAEVLKAPEDVFELMRQFPPYCRVIAERKLRCPAPGEVGRVVRYYKNPAENEVYVLVQEEECFLADHPAEHGRYCRPEWVVPVQYDGNKTPEWADAIRAGEQPDTRNPVLEGIIEGAMAETPQLLFLRMDTGEPIELHPSVVSVEGDRIGFAESGQDVLLTYIEAPFDVLA